MTCIPLGLGVLCVRSNSKARRRHCHICGGNAPFLCDGPRRGKRSKTCDLPLCSRHTRQTKLPDEETRDLCPDCLENLPRLEAEASKQRRRAELAARQMDLFTQGEK